MDCRFSLVFWRFWHFLFLFGFVGFYGLRPLHTRQSSFGGNVLHRTSIAGFYSSSSVGADIFFRYIPLPLLSSPSLVSLPHIDQCGTTFLTFHYTAHTLPHIHSLSWSAFVLFSSSSSSWFRFVVALFLFWRIFVDRHSTWRQGCGRKKKELMNNRKKNTMKQEAFPIFLAVDPLRQIHTAENARSTFVRTTRFDVHL